MEMMTIGMVWLAYIIAEALIKACMGAFITVAIVCVMVVVGCAVYDYMMGRSKKKCDIQKDTVGKL